ncbi:hypothetical protein LQ327_20365 [Actinomycetospora endophytica]|uniref:VIT family protein n=1 Tax=Actinomycetospora endophytica TaxID=2291215 RepID=A0ABS8PFD8_9PSEU|nr:hypothetical protein [Actinomycetospora endophytica]MCD2195729.1 hypothetical protein [Actinomycetospora endophytica]
MPEEPPSEHVAAILRERVYGSITFLSTLLVLTSSLDETGSRWSPAIDLAVTAAGLWAASVFAEYFAMVATRDADDDDAAGYRMHLRATAQILEAAVLPLLLLVAGGLGLLPVRTAAWIGIWVLVVSMALIALLAVRRTGLPWWKRLVLILALVVLALLVVGLKSIDH